MRRWQMRSRRCSASGRPHDRRRLMSEPIDPELLAVFLPEARRYLEALGGDDLEERVRAAHGLRGACAMVGLDALAAQAQAIETLLRTGSDAALVVARARAEIEALDRSGREAAGGQV